jgi:hypothetical protein
MNAYSSSRAGSPLLFGLAPRGVFRAPGVTTGAVGSYPTFSPLPNGAAFRRRPAGFPARCHRAALRRRSILCGTFRSAVVAPSFSPASSTSPPGVTRRVALSRVPLTALRSPSKRPLCGRHWCERRAVNVPQYGVRTFLPSSVISGLARARKTTGTSDHPARPPSPIIPREHLWEG